MAYANGPQIVQNGLVLCLDAGNRKSYPGSGTTWNDLSGANNTGTLTNGPTFSGGNGGSISFDGVNDYATATVPTLTDYSLCFWLYVIALGSGERQIFTAPSDAGSISIVNSNWFSWSGTTGRTGAAMSTGRWYNFIMTRTGSTTNFIVNGSLSNTFASGVTISAGTGYFCSYNNVSRNLNALVSNICFYNRVLTAAEVLQNYNAIRSRFGV
jgi:hypothetical protein